MAFQVSPGVNVTEFDLTTIVPAPVGPVGAIVGEFPWGPIGILQPIENEIKLVERFGKPAVSGNAAITFHTAANYLGYSSNLLVVRPFLEGNSNNATANTKAGEGANVTIKNSAEYSNSYIENNGTVTNCVFAARYAGDLGNNLKISMFKSSNESDFAAWEYSSLFDRKPGTTYYVSEKYNTNANDEVYIVVVDKTSAISGAANTVLERYTASVAKNAKDENNNSLYYRDVLFNKSRWVYWVGHPYNAAISLTASNTQSLNVNTSAIAIGDDIEFTLNTSAGLLVGDTLTFANSANNLEIVGEVLSIGTGNVVTIDVTSTTGNPTPASNVAEGWIATGSVGAASVVGWGVDANATHTFGDLRSTADSQTFELSGGIYGTTTSNVTAGVLNGLDLLADPAIDLSLIMTGPYGAHSTIANYAIGIATDRKDCMAFVSPPLANVTGSDPAAAVANWAEGLTNSSYGVADSGWKYQYDKYNDVYRFIPLNGDIAGVCARTDATRDPWFSPAGQVRGQIRNIVRLAWNPSKAERDTLYRNDVNPVSTFQGEGTYLFGDKTLLGKPSAFDRINVRRLFITLEKAISTAARASLFEFNDEFTRAQFIALVDPYLRSVQAGRGIYDYRVICDSRNNTAEVIDRNQFVGDIFIKPARSINFIQLNFVALRTGVSFEEITGV